jgi:uncharacterized protein YjiS (DUF1127 family)
MLTTINKWWTTLGQVHALSHLDDRLLADAGVDRRDIPRRVRGRPAGPATTWLHAGTEPAGHCDGKGGLCA